MDAVRQNCVSFRYIKSYWNSSVGFFEGWAGMQKSEAFVSGVKAEERVIHVPHRRGQEFGLLFVNHHNSNSSRT